MGSLSVLENQVSENLDPSKTCACLTWLLQSSPEGIHHRGKARTESHWASLFSKITFIFMMPFYSVDL